MACVASSAGVVANPLFVGIDVGTTRVKVGIFDRSGRQHALRIIPHDGLLTPQWGSVTQDAGHWWRTVCRAVRATAADVDTAHVSAIAVCGQGPTLVTTDARLRPCGPALTWMDKRATAEASLLSARLGRSIDAGHLVAKAMRVSHEDPNATRRWYLQAWDYVAARLCGTPHTSAAWLEDEIGASGLPQDHFPHYIPPGTPLGRLTKASARAAGLPAGIQIVAGTNDGVAACIGGGLTRKGRSVLLGGASGGFVLCWDPAPSAWAPPPDTYPEPPDLRYLGATIASSGMALDWLASLFGVHDYDRWLSHAATIPPGADGLVLLPYIAGVFLPYTADERTSVADPAARGVLFGIGARHTSAHMLRATLEGVAYVIRQVYELTVPSGVRLATTLTVGGQAHSGLWNQIKADVLGMTVLTPAVIEAGALGAACLAATGCGAFGDLWEAAEAMVKIAGRLEPNAAAHFHYSRLYTDVYKPLYPQLKGLFPYLHPAPLQRSR